jgi:uncharacterized protein YraI
MSDRDTARSTVAEVAFDGADITPSLRQYLSSITYTDNEEDETDDLNIRIHDRDDVWLTQWLGAALQAAASTPETQGSAASSPTYRTTARSGLNVRSGPGTSHSILGGLAFGTLIEVESITNGWATITHSGRTAFISAQYIEPLKPGSAGEVDSSTSGFTIQAVFIRKNWNTDGKDKVLDCGQFSLDAVTAEGPPSVISIKSTSLPYGTRIRQTKKSKAWESCNLSGVAAGIASEG